MGGSVLRQHPAHALSWLAMSRPLFRVRRAGCQQKETEKLGCSCRLFRIGWRACGCPAIATEACPGFIPAHSLTAGPESDRRPGACIPAPTAAARPFPFAHAFTSRNGSVLDEATCLDRLGQRPGAVFRIVASSCTVAMEKLVSATCTT